MRLDRSSSDIEITEDVINTFVDSTLQMLELTSIQDFLVGSDGQGGLSFEQKKCLSIAVGVASNPSILFLDEPTSDLKRSTGHAICATIHQRSVAMFDSLHMLLLLKCVEEPVYFGELGQESEHLIYYFERFDVTPPIRPIENPATWMLQKSKLLA